MYAMKNLAKLKLLDANAPEGMKAFWAFDKAAMAEGAIPLKYKELIALGVGSTTQCPYFTSLKDGNETRSCISTKRSNYSKHLSANLTPTPER
ncbi:MAG TPA: carboxymuconolactone decarboxylase family protein [Verrucomicrobiae bacterium]|jgi:alkylhydroperoxidase/carboxymuconolactone decarboxylase family protein YurZ|nr:carboxymuconolactone decarboxylase family protein [Verrucomicrobiae bacterium]